MVSPFVNFRKRRKGIILLESLFTSETEPDTNETRRRNHTNESSSSSSSSSDNDDDVLSDTEYTANFIRRKYTHHTVVGSPDKDDDDRITTGRAVPRTNRTTNHNRVGTTTTTTKTTKTATQWPKEFQNIEQKLYHQFHYRDQIYRRLVAVSPPTPPRLAQTRTTTHHDHRDTTSSSSSRSSRSSSITTKPNLFLQSILEREYQVRYCTIDRIIDTLTNKYQRVVPNSNVHRPTALPVSQIHILQQRLYQMVRIMTPPPSNDDDDDDDDYTDEPSTDRTRHYTNNNNNVVTEAEMSPAPVTVWSRWNVVGTRVVDAIIDRDDLLFLRHLFLPALLSLLIHCMIHTSLYDGTLAGLAILRSNFLTIWHFLVRTLFMYPNHNNDANQSIVPNQDNDTWSFFFDPIWTTIVFIFGAVLLRCTGDIFWWSSNSNYQLLKYDFHNRRQLLLLPPPPSNQPSPRGEPMVQPRMASFGTTCTMTQITMWIRQRDAIRATFFMLGYTCCYIASHDYLRYATQFLQYCYNNSGMTQQWNHQALSNLPSIVEMTMNGICFSDRHHCIFSNESFCSATCQNELEYRADHFLWLKREDLDYTRTTLSPHSHDQYWNYWIQKVDFTKVDHYYYPGTVVLNYLSSNGTTPHSQSNLFVGQHPEQVLFWNDDLPPLFLKHEQILFYFVVILSCVGILYINGIKLWEKY